MHVFGRPGQLFFNRRRPRTDLATVAVVQSVPRRISVSGAGIDASQVEACRRGDRRALEALFTAHAPVLERILSRLLGPKADVEDALQQTFIAAIRGMPQFRGEARIETWLGRIAVRQAYESLRRPDARRRARLDLVGEPIDGRPGPERQSESRRQLERLYSHLETLGPKKRLAFVLHVIDGRPMEEVAALMGATTAATKSRVMWARRALLQKARRDPLLRDLVPGGSP